VRLFALLVAAALIATPALAQSPPTLIVEAPAALTSARARIEAYDVRPLAEIVRAVGLEEPGPPMRVVLATTDGDWAARVAPWVAGLAIGEQGLIVLFPERSPSYPHDTLEDVLRHEVTHVLISRAAGPQPVPRWFHEGLAVVMERPWGLEDWTRLVSQLLFGPRLDLAAIDRLFVSDQGSQQRAYSLSTAIVRDVIAQYGSSAPAAILRQAAAGEPFDAALARVTARSVARLEAAFWDRQRTWTTWVPLVASTSVLWLGVIALAALARRRRRQRAADIRRRWADEEAARVSATAHPVLSPQVGDRVDPGRREVEDE